MVKRIFITSGTTTTLPSDWNPFNNQIECYGAGASGNAQSGVGGGGGAYASTTNLNIAAGAVVNIGVGSSGDTWFNATSLANAVSNGQTISVAAQGASGLTGGSAGSSVGTVKNSGGSGGNSDNGGGGGCGGPNGAGGAGGATSNIDNGGGGGGANGGAAGSAGSSSGGGAGGNGFGGSGGGAANGGNATANSGGGGGGSGFSVAGGNGALDNSIYSDGTHGPGGGGGGSSSATPGNAGGFGGGGGGGGTSSNSTGGLIVLTYSLISAVPFFIPQANLVHPQPTSWLSMALPPFSALGYVATPGPFGFWTQPEPLQKHPPELQVLQRGNISSALNQSLPNPTPTALRYLLQPSDVLRHHPKPFITSFGFTPNPTLNPNPVTPSSLAFYTQPIPLSPPPAAPPYQIQIRAWPPLYSGSAKIAAATFTLNATIIETPATGTSDDINKRVGLVIPFRWFSSLAPIKDAIVGGLSDATSWAYSWIPYVKAQLRVVSASGPWLDVAAFDYFNTNVLRKKGQTDATFRAVIQKELIRERVTRKGMINAITDLTGRTPIVFEPWNNGDAGSWDSGAVAWDAGVGGWGDTILPSQSFLTVFRPGLQGIPAAGAWDTGFAAWDTGGDSVWVDQFQVVGAVTDTDIYRTINLTKPVGSVIWTQLQ